ncbi:MAG TPA: proton-conducting transporter membrane subunit, partial [Pirellulaceae bacterium]|nr:proton-conducting transporter membrane subunit [Pirellulaceae bacterium]
GNSPPTKLGRSYVASTRNISGGTATNLRRCQPRSTTSKLSIDKPLVQQQNIDLVVMGTIARTYIPDIVMGNPAERLLDRVECSILAIKPAGDLFTFLIFYEMLTLTTYPLVVHRGTEQSLRAGRICLAYTLCGSAVLLLGVVWLSSIVGSLDFTEGGFLGDADPAHHMSLVVIFALMIVGVGVKAAVVLLHGWLPAAMVAPTPVSALLHAVAVVKAGAIGVLRIVYDVFGVEFCSTLGVTGPLAVVAAVSIRAAYHP